MFEFVSPRRKHKKKSQYRDRSFNILKSPNLNKKQNLKVQLPRIENYNIFEKKDAHEERKTSSKEAIRSNAKINK